VDDTIHIEEFYQGAVVVLVVLLHSMTRLPPLTLTLTSLDLTFGTKISPMDNKLHRSMAKDTKAKLAFCWLFINSVIGAVITHSTCKVRETWCTKLAFCWLFINSVIGAVITHNTCKVSEMWCNHYVSIYCNKNSYYT
jgi:hypothetical protein